MTPGTKSKAHKTTVVAGSIGALPVLLELLQGHQNLSNVMTIALIIAVTSVAVSYNISRGLSKEEEPGAEKEGAGQSELRITTFAGGLAALPVMLDMLRDNAHLAESVKVTLIGCAAVLVISFNISRGMARTEPREEMSPPLHAKPVEPTDP